MVGFLVGNAFAILLAALLVRWPALEVSVLQVSLTMHSLPIVAIAPLLVLWLGTGYAPRIAIARSSRSTRVDEQTIVDHLREDLAQKRSIASTPVSLAETRAYYSRWGEPPAFGPRWPESGQARPAGSESPLHCAQGPG
jgi:hypothetical protein